MSECLPPNRTERSVGLFAAGVAALLAFYCIGSVFLDGYRLDLGSLNFPPPSYLTFVALWTVFGGASAVLLAIATARRVRSSRTVDRLVTEWNAISSRRFLFWTCAAAVAIPVTIRVAVLHQAPLADDESAYRFAAQLLARGRLWVASPPMKVFFDQNFMINDGRLYSVYFLGWPALLAAGVLVRAPGLINPILSGLTVPALFGVIRRFSGSGWARAGVLLFLSAPFIQIAAATLLAHTSCLMALTWCLLMYLRATEARDSWLPHAGFGFAFALAFCIRPQSAVALGFPLLVAWAFGLRQIVAGRRAQALLAFSVPTVLLAALFLGSLWAQNGSPWRVGYMQYAAYIGRERVRFTTFNPAEVGTVAGFDFSQIIPALARTAVGMFRLNADLFGWPCSLALLLVALPGREKRGRILWWLIASYLAFMFFQDDWGIDTFGPVHAFELALPILVLTVIGARNMHERLSDASRSDATGALSQPTFAPALFASLIVVAWLGFVPVRLEAVRQIAAHINVSLRAPERSGLHHAVIFAPLPFAPSCDGAPAHFVWFHPVNDPDLRNDILWVNQLNPQDDLRLMDQMPGRTGYVMNWSRDCTVHLVPLAGAVGGRPAGKDPG